MGPRRQVMALAPELPTKQVLRSLLALSSICLLANLYRADLLREQKISNQAPCSLKFCRRRLAELANAREQTCFVVCLANSTSHIDATEVILTNLTKKVNIGLDALPYQKHKILCKIAGEVWKG